MGSLVAARLPDGLVDECCATLCVSLGKSTARRVDVYRHRPGTYSFNMYSSLKSSML